MNRSPRILIVRTDRMGDVILSTPVIRNLRRAFPDGYLAMMVRPENRELVEGNPDLNAVILYDKDRAEQGISGNLRFARRLRQHRFDTALILHSTNRVILATWLAGIRWRVGFARRLGWMLTDRLPYIKKEGERHEMEYNLDLLPLLGIHPSTSSGSENSGQGWERTLFIPVQPEQEAKVSAFLQSNGVNRSATCVVLHPGASCPSKRWPAERFAALGERLVRQHGARVVVVTGPAEKERGRAVIERMRSPAISALGTFSLGELACLFRQARCLISNDSGPVHLACAVGTPVISIFGRWGAGLSPKRWGPTGPNSFYLHKDIGCRPCLAHRCTIGFACLTAVTVEEVLVAAENAAGLKREVALEVSV